MIYPISEHRFISVAELDEKDGRIAELTAENERLKDFINGAEAAITVQRNRVKWHKERIAELTARNAILKSTVRGLQMFAEEDAVRIKELEALVQDLTAALESREARF